MNKPKRAMLVFGTRPEAIKMAPVVHALRSDPVAFETLVCVTAQHRSMLDQALRTFELAPDIDLDLMTAGQDLFDVTSAVLRGMRDVLTSHRPEVVLVHGDTTTAFAASLEAFYLGIPVAHVEAGLRTHDLRAPFPEEFNRQSVTKLASLHFAPTEQSRSNLMAEGVAPSSIAVTGNTVIDAMFLVLQRLEREPARAAAVEHEVASRLRFSWRRDRFVLITGHRRENFGQGFVNICAALKALALRFPSVHFVYPVHLNPNVRAPVNEVLGDLKNVHLIEPLDYEPFILLLKHCHLVLTDSGGIQEEAPSLGKPVLVMREVSERPEAISAGTVKLVGADRDRIVANVAQLLEDEAMYQGMARAHNPYGDGMASGRIVDMLRRN